MILYKLSRQGDKNARKALNNEISIMKAMSSATGEPPDTLLHKQAALAEIALDAAKNMYVVKGTKINLRSSPGTKSKIITQLNTGEYGIILEKTNVGKDVWCKFSCNKGEGWILEKFLTKAQQ